jgi:hypothetical protein
MDVRYGKNGNAIGHSPACGLMWLAIGGLIVALSVLDAGQMPSRETLVYGAQGVIVSLYGWYRLRLAWPMSAEMRTKSTRSHPDRVQVRPYRAQARGQIAAPFRAAPAERRRLRPASGPESRGHDLQVPTWCSGDCARESGLDGEDAHADRGRSGLPVAVVPPERECLLAAEDQRPVRPLEARSPARRCPEPSSSPTFGTACRPPSSMTIWAPAAATPRRSWCAGSFVG